MFEPVERSRAFERVVDQIEQAIYTGRLKPGDHLPSERTLVEEFRVGRSSVREALRILESMGLLVTQPGSQLGPKVSASGKAGLLRMLSGYVHTRGIGLGSLVQYRMISGSAANLLAAHLRTDEQLAEMRAATAAMRAAGPNDDDFARQDVRFHQVIADASGNPFLTMVNGVIADVIVALMKSALEHAPDQQQIRAGFLALHERLIDAIDRRDGLTASHIARQSLYDYYCDLLDDEERSRLALLLPHPAHDGAGSAGVARS